jgi:O-antigen biosynthesis protein
MPDADRNFLIPPSKDDIEALRASELFDAEWYQQTYPDVKAMGMDPAEHYLWLGARLRRKPSKDFDPVHYLKLNADAAAAGENPLLHYLRSGERSQTEQHSANSGSEFNDQIAGRAALRLASLTTPPAIIVPIHNAAEHLEPCIQSVLHHTTQDFRLILLDDASPDPRVQDLLWRFAVLPNVTVVCNGTNLGYTATVNRGISLAGRADVVLLNSDTQVTPLWLRNLQLAAYSGERVATATALSNNAGAFSAPKIDMANPIPERLDLDAYARLVTRRAARLYPEVPTGNGFCMYIRRQCIDETGTFDADAFPRGYGEENDFCLRAAAAGWTHVVDDATLIYHVRSASFGDDRELLSRQGRAIIDQRYPGYGEAVKDMFADPVLDEARRNVERAGKTHLAPQGVRPRILFVISTTSGGTPRTNEDLMGALVDRAETYVLHCDSRVIKLFAFAEGAYTELNSHVLKSPLRRAVARAMAPKPMRPSVAPSTSRPTRRSRGQCPAATSSVANQAPRRSSTAPAMTYSATESTLAPVAGMTAMPRARQASRAILSSPTPRRPTTRKASAAASSCSFTRVRLRTMSARAPASRPARASGLATSSGS